jgi:glycosyltransferase involved in cell wall biosynthesis
MFTFAKERCARVLAVSEATRRDIIEHLGIEPERITVTPLAPRAGTRRVDDAGERAAALSAVGLTPDTRFVLYAGTLEPRKNLPRLLEAFALCAREGGFEKLRLVLAGGASEEYATRLHARAAELGIAERVLFAGYVPDHIQNALMSACDLFAYVSQYEGFGLPPLEAMACGAPVVASNVASLPEVLGESALLVRPDDVGEIARAVTRVLDDETMNTQLRAMAVAQAAKFTWEQTAKLTLQAYEAANAARA